MNSTTLYGISNCDTIKKARNWLRDHAIDYHFHDYRQQGADADLLRSGLRFDERYFLYVEDLDFCAAVRARGRSLWVTQRATVRHADGGTRAADVSARPGKEPNEKTAGQEQYRHSRREPVCTEQLDTGRG